MAIFIHDTRDKVGKHEILTDDLQAMGHQIVRSKMYVGDIALLNNQSVCIDLKQDLAEVYSNVVSQHKRFKAELERANDAHIRLIILVMQSGIKDYNDVCKWVNPRLAYWYRMKEYHDRGYKLDKKISKMPPMSSTALANAMATMTTKYKVEWQFCDKKDVAKKVLEILGVQENGNTK